MSILDPAYKHRLNVLYIDWLNTTWICKKAKIPSIYGWLNSTECGCLGLPKTTRAQGKCRNVKGGFKAIASPCAGTYRGLARAFLGVLLTMSQVVCWTKVPAVWFTYFDFVIFASLICSCFSESVESVGFSVCIAENHFTIWQINKLRLCPWINLPLHKCFCPQDCLSENCLDLEKSILCQ